MLRDAEFFEDRPLTLIYIGKRLSESQAVEAVLTEAAIDYAVEVDLYTGGVIFRRDPVLRRGCGDGGAHARVRAC